MPLLLCVFLFPHLCPGIRLFPYFCLVHVKYFINTGDSTPVSMRSRRTPEALKSKVWEQLRTMLAKQVIRISSSPYAAGIVMYHN
jgi:hypothetical protein